LNGQWDIFARREQEFGAEMPLSCVSFSIKNKDFLQGRFGRDLLGRAFGQRIQPMFYGSD
jgi:hypothetical protein